MFVGFFLRRIVTVALCAAAFWAGAKTDNLLASGGGIAGSNCAGATNGN